MKILSPSFNQMLTTLALCASTLSGFAQRPTANFTATPLSGCAPLLVNFTDQSNGNPTSWRWTLGNGSQATVRNPSAVYTNPGTYTVKLIVTNSSGRDSLTRTAYINVYAKPNVQFTGSNTSGCGPLTVSFTDNSNAGSGTIQSRKWDFGDGTLSTERNPSHVYNSSGNYNVSLLVTNSVGCTSSTTLNRFVQVIPNPLVGFTNNTSFSCSTPFSVNFQNQSSATGPISFLWNFGDGTSSTGINPSHVYRNPGTYTVKLKAFNASGCSDSLTRTNLIVIQNNRVGFTTVERACVNNSVSFTSTSSPTPQSTTWRFGDGTTSTETNPTKSYSAPGIYYITKIDNFGRCIDSITQSISITARPVSAFTGTNLTACRTPLAVNFTAQSINTDNYVWDFGDGTTSTDRNPVHSYTQEGSFTITLISSHNAGCADTLIQNNYVNIQFPVASINNFPRPGCVPITHSFSASITGSDSVVSYLWNFGDNGISTDSAPTHTFTDRGRYDMSLIISTASGCTDTVYYNGAVRGGNKPNPDFEATTTSTCASQSVVFNNLTPPSDSAKQWWWVFGDGTFSGALNPTHLFIDTGIFDIKLVGIDNGCASDTFVRPQYVTVWPPIAKFRVINDCSNRLVKKFEDQSIGADGWLWDFGDGETSSDQHPVHRYARSGRYTVRLVVTNSTWNCSAFRSFGILVCNQVPTFDANPTSICRTFSSTFKASGFTPDYFSSFNWNFGDGVTGSDTAVTKIYYNTGVYNIRLISKDKNNCVDTITRLNYLKVNGPRSLFTASNTTPCRKTAVVFSDNSTSDGRNPIVKRIWSWGDGTSDTLVNETNIAHTYNSNGVFSVRLKVIDSFGCESILTKNSHISVNSPITNFYTGDTLTCANSNVRWINNTAGTGNTFKWSFGNGQTSTDISPISAYSTQGNFNVSLVTTNSIGCSDTLNRINYVKVNNPIAAFTADNYVGNCPPLIVNFTNTSQYFRSQVWDFGDGTSSNSSNPSHFYSISGNYTAKVTVTSPGGCTTSFQHSIVVHGPRGTLSYNNTAGCTPLTKSFVADITNASEMVWDFNDGITLQSMTLQQNHQYTLEGSYLPKLLLKDNSGCVVPVMGRDTIRVNKLRPYFNMGDHEFCQTGSITFDNASSATDAISSYAWDFGDGVLSSDMNPSHEYTSIGRYIPKLTATTVTGCTGTFYSPDTVKINAVPRGQISQNTSNICQGGTVRFNGTNLGNPESITGWNWNFGNGNTSTSANPDFQTYRIAGSLPVLAIISNADGCTETLRTTINVHPTPIVSAGPDTFSCRGTGVRLRATGADNYTWSASAGLSCTTCADPLADPTVNTEYRLSGKTIYGCEAKDTINIAVVYPFTLTVNAADSICRGESKQLNASGGYRYNWTPRTGLDNPSIANPVATPDITTNYRVEATDEKACFQFTKTVPVIVHDKPTVELEEETTAIVGFSIDLKPKISSDVVDARWSPTEALLRNEFPNITVKPMETTTYTIDVFNGYGCTAQDRITVNVVCNNANLFVPNSFSPNGDGMNDIFFPRGTGIFTIKSLRIFSRWGEVIYQRNNFKANDPSKAWDGTFKGQKMNADAFVYTIEVLCDNNATLTYKGTVTLIR